MPEQYYFDFKDGVSRRDRIGAAFASDSEAIRHGKTLVKAERIERPAGDRDLVISVVNEMGNEIYSENIFPILVENSLKK